MWNLIPHWCRRYCTCQYMPGLLPFSCHASTKPLQLIHWDHHGISPFKNAREVVAINYCHCSYPLLVGGGQVEMKFIFSAELAQCLQVQLLDAVDNAGFAATMLGQEGASSIVIQV